MALEIRVPHAADADAAGRMHYAAWREAYAHLLPGEFWTEAREQSRIDLWRTHLAKPSDEIAVRIAVREGAVVGYAIAAPAPSNPSAGAPARDRELQGMYVLAAEYGTGLAAALLDAVLPGDRPAQLWVFVANPRARRFYEKHGFRADGAGHVFGPEWGGLAEMRMVR